MTDQAESFEGSVMEDDGWTVVTKHVTIKTDYYRAAFDEEFTRAVMPTFADRTGRGRKTRSQHTGFDAYVLQREEDCSRRHWSTPGKVLLISQSNADSSHVALVIEPNPDTVVIMDWVDGNDKDYTLKAKCVGSNILRIKICSDQKILVVSTVSSLLVIGVNKMEILKKVVENDRHVFAVCKGTIAYTQSLVNDGMDVHIISYMKPKPPVKITTVLPEAVECMCFDENCNMLAIASKDGFNIRTHDATTGAVLHVFCTTRQDLVIQTMNISLSHLVVTTNEKDVLVYNLTKGVSKFTVTDGKTMKVSDATFDASIPKRGPSVVLKFPDDLRKVPHSEDDPEKPMVHKNACMIMHSSTLQGAVTYDGWVYYYDITVADGNYTSKFVGRFCH